MPRLTIIGLGLIGGSLGMALKRAGLPDLEIAGYDREPDVERQAVKLNAIDRAGGRTPEEAVEGAAVVVVATPILQVRGVFEAIAPALGEGAVVTDTASTKRDILAQADELLPEHVSFVGGHPIAGKEHGGIESADAALFEGRPWAITPSVRATQDAIETIESLVRTAGGQPVFIDAAEHDSYLAAVSHLPLVAATALFSLASGTKAWPELAALAGPGFRDTTRLASTNPDLSHDITLANRENVLHWLDRYTEELQRLRSLIADEQSQEKVIELFANIQAVRDDFLESPPAKPGPESAKDPMSPGERMLSFMVGEYIVRRTKEVEQLMKEREEAADPKRRRKDH